MSIDRLILKQGNKKILQFFGRIMSIKSRLLIDPEN